tara:strand:+ start:106 stop:279 length:174 start_codon:yes stop_codon:yes gene_type:complete
MYEPKVVVTIMCQALNEYLETFDNKKDERYEIAFNLHDFMVCAWEDLHRADERDQIL